MQSLRRRVSCVLLVSLALSLLAGCDGLTYVAHVAEGQFGIQGDVQPIADVLASGRLSETDAAKLRLIVAARDYAADVIGLDAGDSYTTFYDTEGDPLAFNLSAARPDALIAHTWTFPILGEVPYLAFFDEAYLREVEQDLIDQGLDTFTYELDAYSTLGVFEDPVRSTMLRRNELSLSETIIHELLHNTIWRPGETVFNESLATFVGRRGAVEFLRAEFGDDSGWPEFAVAYYADIDAVNEFLSDLHGDLSAYYATPADKAAKIAGREEVYEASRTHFVADIKPALNLPDWFGGYASLPTNNAWMLGNHRYNFNLAVFEDVFTAVDQDWPAALAVFRDAANASGDPFTYLRNWLNGQGE